ncbi:MAG: hypothetical protein M3Y69_09500 [Verrucomicrobiota bacterium]|nr:hypothetical protein [Verrucomicrobiota bacterium]
MAKEPGHEKSAAELKQQIAHSRDRLARDLAGLRYELDFPLKFRKSFQRHAGIWISAAVVGGVVATARGATKTKTKIVYRMPWGKPDEQKKGEEQKKGLLQAGLAMGALKFGATMLRPVIMSIITKKIGSYAGGSASSRKW